MELNIVKDVQQGITKSYFETGELEWKENYLDGDKNGISKQYYKNGEVRYFFLYKNNQLNGESKYYSSQGKLIDTMIL